MFVVFKHPTSIGDNKEWIFFLQLMPYILVVLKEKEAIIFLH